MLVGKWGTGMIRHVVLFRLRPGISVDDPRVVAACRAEEGLETGGEGAEVVTTPSWHFAADVSRRPVSADFVGVGHFASRAELDRFLDSDAHRHAAGAWEGLAVILIADVELSAASGD